LSEEVSVSAYREHDDDVVVFKSTEKDSMNKLGLIDGLNLIMFYEHGEEAWSIKNPVMYYVTSKNIDFVKAISNQGYTPFRSLLKEHNKI
jgi:hypothetical protein